MSDFEKLIATPGLVRPGVLDCEPGVIQTLPTVLKSQGLARPVLVADPIMHTLGQTERIADILSSGGLALAGLFTEVVPEPDEASIQPVADLIKTSGADCLVSLGGGSAIDSAKAAALLCARGGPLRLHKAPHRIEGDLLPHLAVPTTAGTGSEATQFTVITDSSTGEKMLLAGPSLLPDMALVDAELSMTQPPRLTADTGLDALTHAIEAYVSRKANDRSDPLALHAMTVISGALLKAHSHGDDVVARRDMMEAATLAGLAFSNASVALVHGMSRPIGAHFHVPHGLSNAMLLPTLTAFGLSAAEGRYADCARACGFAEMSDTDAVACRKLVAGLADFNAALAVPSLRSFGIEEAAFSVAIDQMCTEALASGSPSNNPRVPSEAEMARLYAMIYAEAPALEASSL